MAELTIGTPQMIDIAQLHHCLKNTKLRLKEDYGWDNEFVDGAVNEYYRFLIICKMFPLTKFVPGKVVDKVWHDHILHTKEYIEFCNRYFGEYVHHTPLDRSLGTKHDFQPTIDKYTSLFGHNPPAKFWTTDVKLLEPQFKQHIVSYSHESGGGCCR